MVGIVEPPVDPTVVETRAIASAWDALSTDRARIVHLIGSGGTGKSTTIRVMGNSWQEAGMGPAVLLDPSVVEGSVRPYDIVARHIEDVRTAFEQPVALRPGDATRGRLLIAFDNLELLEPTFAMHVLPPLFEAWPDARVLIASRKEVNLPEPALIVECGAFTQLEVSLLAHRVIPDRERVDSVLATLYSRGLGHPLMTRLVLDHIARRHVHSPEELLATLDGKPKHALLDPDGRPMSFGSRRGRLLIAHVREVSDALIRSLALNPQQLYDLPPRRFEEVVAELLAREGYQVSLTGRSADGGVDIYAARHDKIGSLLYLVQCKRQRMTNPVSVNVVRALAGLVHAEQVTAGVVVTTSRFTRPARQFSQQLRFQMWLHDYLAVQQWLADASAVGDSQGRPSPP